MADVKPNAQQAALLASIAQSGSAGALATAPPAPAGKLGAAQGAAISAANGRADQIQAPAGFYEKQAQQIAEPFQTSGRDASAAQAAQSAYTGGIGNTANTYQSEVQQAQPVLQQLAQESVNKSNDPFKLQQQQWAVEDRQYANQKRDADQKAQNDYSNQQQFLQTVNTNPSLSQDAKDTFNGVISQSGGDYATAMSKLAAASALVQTGKKADGSKMTSAEKTKALSDVQAIQPYLSQYFYPSGNAAAAANSQANQIASPQIAAPSVGNGVQLPNILTNSMPSNALQAAQAAGRSIGNAAGRAKNFLGL